LKPRGVFRINVPSLEEPLRLFQEGATEDALAFFFPRSAADIRRVGMLGQHRYLYDWPTLERLLRDAGFTHVEQRRKREGTVPDLDVLENRSETGLYVEAFEYGSNGRRE
jgi:hypothetical protein